MKQRKLEIAKGNPLSVRGSSSAGPVIAVNRRAKIICTIGPACHSEAAMRDLMRLGMDVGRLNFSHGSHEDHARNISRLRSAAEKENRTICILQDLQGPKIRTGRLATPRTHRSDKWLSRGDYSRAMSPGLRPAFRPPFRISHARSAWRPHSAVATD